MDKNISLQYSEMLKFISSQYKNITPHIPGIDCFSKKELLEKITQISLNQYDLAKFKKVTKVIWV